MTDLFTRREILSVIKTVGSICSGIEAASVAWNPLGFSFQWFSEIAPFPSYVLRERFPHISNVGDMNKIPSMLREEKLFAPDLICAGTPCQAFSLAGSQCGLNDERGNLTLKFVDIVEANDYVRKKNGLAPSIVFWENVEGVLKDRTNAFGCLISALAGLKDTLSIRNWPNAGVLRGIKRNVAWRVLDAKYFGLPQQRRRLYVMAGGKSFNPENILFELHKESFPSYPSIDYTFEKDGHRFEIFREYTDCLYSAYATKWNGNAAAYNGSLFVVQDDRLRRLSPLECERLMGFPDNYTNLEGASRTNRYQAIGNSWAVPVIQWIGSRIVHEREHAFTLSGKIANDSMTRLSKKEVFFNLGKNLFLMKNGVILNCTEICENPKFQTLPEIVSPDAPEEIYISPVGCYGILRRKKERNLCINYRLKSVLSDISSQMSVEEIEKQSRKQQRGKYSKGLL